MSEWMQRLQDLGLYQPKNSETGANLNEPPSKEGIQNRTVFQLRASIQVARDWTDLEGLYDRN